MSDEKLDLIAERVKAEFLARILDLNNNQTEYVCVELAQWFEGFSESEKESLAAIGAAVDADSDYASTPHPSVHYERSEEG